MAIGTSIQSPVFQVSIEVGILMGQIKVVGVYILVDNLLHLPLTTWNVTAVLKAV
jgi:hypothetical protein